jgi:hypothetical protein
MISINPRNVLVCILTANDRAPRNPEASADFGEPIKAETPLWGEAGFPLGSEDWGINPLHKLDAPAGQKVQAGVQKQQRRKGSHTTKTATPLSGIYSPGGAAVELVAMSQYQ